MVLVSLLGLFACAPIERSETRTPIEVRTHTREKCRWVPNLEVSLGEGGVIADVADRRECTRRVVEERRMRVVRAESPDGGVLAAEVAATLVGGTLMVVSYECGDLGDCLGKVKYGFLGFAIIVPAGVATVVDVAKYRTRTDYEDEVAERSAHTVETARRPSIAVPVKLELGDGRSVEAFTNADGRAFLPISDELWGERDEIECRVVTGTLERRVRLSRH